MNGTRSTGAPRRLGAVLAGAVLAASLAGCSLDTSAFRNHLESSWEASEDAPSASSAPASLAIPAIEVRRDLIDVQIQDDDTLEVPSSGEDVGWFSPDENPEGNHPTVFVAHVDTPTGPGVFGRLMELGPGDEVEVTNLAGDVHVYRVDRVEDHPVDDFPTLDVYGPVAGDEIRLLTCNGEFDSIRQQYEDNRVVFASRVG